MTRLLPQFAKCPRDCAARLASVLSRPGSNSIELLSSLESLRQLWAEAVALTEAAYQPRFDLTAAVSVR